jgi:hypothetical protein
MRKLLLGLLLVTGCASSTEPSVVVVDHRCTVYQLPDGSVYDSCR